MRIACAAVLAVSVSVGAFAQDMPDPSLIHGRAIPASDLPDGTVTIRVVREAIGNNVSGQHVRVTAGGTTRTATTDAQGRAEFRDLPKVSDARAEATVDGEALVSQPFPVPTSGGLRVILVAGIARAAEKRKQEEAAAAAAPPTRGIVVIGGDSRVVLQFNADRLQAFYVLEIMNTARTRVDIGGPLIIDLPRVAQGTRVLEGSTPDATANGSRVTVRGPFASGTTMVQIGFGVPYSNSELTLEQKFPVPVQGLTIAVEKVGNLAVSSPQLQTTREIRTEGGEVFILGTGAPLQADGTLAITLSNLVVDSKVPRYAALGLAAMIVALGIWLATSGGAKRDDGHQALVKRRTTLLSQLEQLELKRRAGSVDGSAYATRRQRIVSELERIYGELDEAGAGPKGGGGEGVAA